MLSSLSISSVLLFSLLTTSIYAQDDTEQLQFPKFTRESCLNLPTLICSVTGTESFTTEGFVYFTPTWQKRNETSEEFTCYTKVEAEIANLTPNHEHGFHIHAYGDLSDKNGKSTGGHFAHPENATDSEIEHGYPDDNIRHWGDFGNLTTDENGVAKYDRVDKVIRLGGILGRGITIHENHDQGKDEQPSGNAGSRVGFGVIGFANPEFLQ